MKKFIFIFLIVMLTVFISYSAFAYGIGAYVTGGGGGNIGRGYNTPRTNLQGNLVHCINSYPTKKLISNLGGGLLIDTNPVGKGFNYRLNVGFDQWEESLNNPIKFFYEFNHFNTTNVARIHLINDFGYNLYNSTSSKIWFGPQIGLGAGLRDGNLKLFTVSLGPVLGINLNLSENLLFCTDISVRCSFISTQYNHEDISIDPYSPLRFLGIPVFPSRQRIYNYHAGLTGNLTLSLIYKI